MSNQELEPCPIRVSTAFIPLSEEEHKLLMSRIANHVKTVTNMQLLLALASMRELEFKLFNSPASIHIRLDGLHIQHEDYNKGATIAVAMFTVIDFVLEGRGELEHVRGRKVLL